MSDYVDRGIIKWAPFDGLAGFNDLYLTLKYNLNKKDKPILSDEQLHYMDLTIKEAIYQNRQIIVIYFKNGYTNNLYGLITKIDHLNKLIYLDNIPLEVGNIIGIDLI
ncbi:MAG: YolD-like family protein [Acholeplasmataceae bacterium]|jgi:hypothetical protein